jgi:putative nucleotidyltransferase with HDIG domain
MPQQQVAANKGMDFSALEQLWFGDLPDTDAEQAAAESMLADTARIVGLHPFPETANKILQLSRDPACEVSRLTRLIENDPSFAVKTLRLVNSAAFSRRVSCTTIAHAVTLLGIKTIGELAASWAVLEMFDRPDPRYVQLKGHATTVAALARHLATRLGQPADDIYTCGLMHDLGKLLALEDDADADAHSRRLEASAPDTMHLAEREAMGFDHALLAAHVMRQWEIPDPVPLVVGWHHQAARALNEGGDVARMVSLVRVADRLAYALFDTSAEPDTTAGEVAKDSCCDYLGLTEDKLERWWFELAAVANEGRQIAGGAPEEAGASCHICQGEGAQERCQTCGCAYCADHAADAGDTCSACGGPRSDHFLPSKVGDAPSAPARGSNVVYYAVAGAAVLAAAGIALAVLV